MASILKKLPILLILLGIVSVSYSALKSYSDELKDESGHSGRFRSGRQGKDNAFSALHSAGLEPVYKFFRVYTQAWDRVQAEADRLRRSDEDNHKLRLENVTLKIRLETSQLEFLSKTVSKKTESISTSLNHETGSHIGRTPASISYHPPENLNHSQLYTLAISYLKGHEDEKAAVIFTLLAQTKQTALYRTPRTLLVTGIAWFRVQNYTLADHYFDEVLTQSDQSESLKFQAQARLWKALVAKKLNQDSKTKHWLKELLDYHPHSQEASWVN